jgi:Asp-tRNA(Asn)/Glu-tRNA(Gln) amidotransferase A subunit family amidase
VDNLTKPTPDPSGLTATAAARALRAGEITCVDLVQACLERIDATEDEVRAWTFLDRDYALAQAKAVDGAARVGRPRGPLHGLPVGVKDIIDTRDMPTENGTVLHSGRRPTADATVVSLLRQAGAVILGKTVTTELAVYAPGKTRNPHNLEHTPGGSSSGSAAAVAAGMVPLSVGTQTNGSVIRPASFCGVYGYKPTAGLVSRHGVLSQSPPLDQIGFFARSIEDLALVAEPLMAFDERDPAMHPMARAELTRTAGEEPPLTPHIGFARTPVWDQAEASTQEAFAELVEALGDDVEEIAMAEPFDKVVDWHRVIMEADLAKSFAEEYARGADRLSAILREMIERGQHYLAVDYNRAVDWIRIVNAVLDEAFRWNDALLTPATIGPAPASLDSTGSPIFCTLWTYLGVPTVTLPLFHAENGMPFGAQLVGRRGDDARLLRTARWLVERVQAEAATE